MSPRAAGVVRLVVLAALVPVAAAAAAGPKPLQPRVFADTGVRLTDVVWTGTRFLYVENTTNRVFAAGPQGAPVRQVASMPSLLEETRCRLSPSAHGFAADDVYCHAPDNTIYRIGPDGTVSVFATLPDSSVSDGALAFDTVGRFGYALVAATGRSGAAEPSGGDVYAIDATGAVRRIGSYSGPGGADEIAVAPARLAAGQLVIGVDAGARGTLVLMDALGRTRTIASLPDGPGPLAAVAAPPRHPRPSPPPGLYFTDTGSTDVFLVPAAQLAPYIGDVIVGSEMKGLFWVVRPRPHGRGLQTVLLPTTLPPATYDLEGATYVAG
ncbi:MAG TPA: hypothetical protein VMS63_02175 [Gaiellaceae bacterium]|nr:hypothetical protein [Gaiellaceae bacterium]